MIIHSLIEVAFVIYPHSRQRICDSKTSSAATPLIADKKLDRSVIPTIIRLTGCINFALTAVSPIDKKRNDLMNIKRF
jgi:hypothetical protein